MCSTRWIYVSSRNFEVFIYPSSHIWHAPLHLPKRLRTDFHQIAKRSADRKGCDRLFMGSRPQERHSSSLGGKDERYWVAKIWCTCIMEISWADFQLVGCGNALRMGRPDHGFLDFAMLLEMIGEWDDRRNSWPTTWDVLRKGFDQKRCGPFEELELVVKYLDQVHSNQ